LSGLCPGTCVSRLRGRWVRETNLNLKNNLQRTNRSETFRERGRINVDAQNEGIHRAGQRLKAEESRKCRATYILHTVIQKSKGKKKSSSG